LESDAPELEALPKDVPEPGHYDDSPQLRAPGELATLGVGWALLHEVRHLKPSHSTQLIRHTPAS